MQNCIAIALICVLLNVSGCSQAWDLGPGIINTGSTSGFTAELSSLGNGRGGLAHNVTAPRLQSRNSVDLPKSTTNQSLPIQSRPIQRGPCEIQPSQVASSLPAFPGAQGYGSKTTGGRGGKTLKVTSLLDDGSAGTLRWAIDFSGPRVVVFEIGGLINLRSRLVIRNPYITIAAQTAPGSGITLSGGQQFAIRTHDVIIRGLRSRPGDGPGDLGSNRDAISIGNACNVVIDHCVFTWATDENVSIWFGSHDVTISHSIIAQGLADSIHPNGSHSMGMIIGDDSHRISIHNNVFAFNEDRNPLLKNAYHVELINNFIHSWRDGGIKVYPNETAASKNKPMLHAIGNYLQHGHGTLRRPGMDIRGNTPIYIRDNFDSQFRWSAKQAQSTVAHNANNQISSHSPLLSNEPLFKSSGIKIRDIPYVRDQVLNSAGTSNNPHLVEKVILSKIKERESGTINSPEEMGGYGKDTAGEAPADRDGDGIPDDFELENGSDPSVKDANSDANKDGYTNIENYINSFF